MKAKRLFAKMLVCVLGSLFFVQCALCPCKSHKGKSNRHTPCSLVHSAGSSPFIGAADSLRKARAGS